MKQTLGHSETILQYILNFIDDNIKENITVSILAEKAGYSVHHFSRMFSEYLGIPVTPYITWRKLQYAVCDLSQGMKVVNAAFEYGFETHAGFTKAFRRCFGYPPSLCYLHISADKPEKINIKNFKTHLFGGKTMNPHIIEFTPFWAVGYPSRHRVPSVKRTGDIPSFWETIKLNYSDELTKLYDTFTLSKHFEIGIFCDRDEKSGEFTYVLGRGVDIREDLNNLEPDMTLVEITGGLYAVFTTPLVEESEYTQSIRSTWEDILLHWLPQSEFEYDDTRKDFEYYDRRDHGCYFGGKVQMDICIPIQIRQSEK